MENRIESFAELENALTNLTVLSDEIAEIFQESQRIYEEQKDGWYSANSMREAEKMVDYATEADKIAKNIRIVSDAIQMFKTKTKETDEQ